MADTRWASFSRREHHSGEYSHHVRPGAVTSLCGITALPATMWRADRRKPRCPTCVARLDSHRWERVAAQGRTVYWRRYPAAGGGGWLTVARVYTDGKPTAAWRWGWHPKRHGASPAIAGGSCVNIAQGRRLADDYAKENRLDG